MTQKIEGIIPVMITPFTANGQIDYPGLGRLVEWYIDNGSDALFAVCQSSEMQFLSLEERVELAAFVKQAAAGRVPVIASGHISESLDDQLAELTAIAATGVDGMVLVTNRLDARREGGSEVHRRSELAARAAAEANSPRSLRMPGALSPPAHR